MRLPLQVLDGVRAACGPEMIVGVRLGVDDLREGGLRPAGAAEIARRMQDRVDYLSVRIHVGEGEGITSLFPLIRGLAELDVDVIERAVPAKLAAGRLQPSGVFGEARPAIDVDTVVVRREGRPQTGLLAPLREAGIEPVLIGDALRPRRVQDAVADGARVARETPSPSSGNQIAG